MTLPNAWTPSTPASSFARAERCEVAGPQRVYLYDLDTRAEIESPLAGLRILAHGDGSRVKGKPARVGKDWVRAFKAGEVK